jgi:hypothetical protein
MIQELVNVKALEGGFSEVARMVHGHPTLSEAVMEQMSGSSTANAAFYVDLRTRKASVAWRSPCERGMQVGL